MDDLKGYNLFQRTVYYITYGVVVAAMSVFYVLKQGEEIVRHHMCRYIRLWKEEIDQ